MDRDWYREELAQRRRHNRGNWRDLLRGMFAVMAIVLAMFATLPVTLTSRCDLGGWQTTPTACWRQGLAALSDRVAANMAATRGWRVTIVRLGF